jgi:hypothetical protein
MSWMSGVNSLAASTGMHPVSMDPAVMAPAQRVLME